MLHEELQDTEVRGSSRRCAARGRTHPHAPTQSAEVDLERQLREMRRENEELTAPQLSAVRLQISELQVSFAGRASAGRGDGG